jgi:hypothetical protein
MALTRRGRHPKTADIPIKFKPFRTDLITIDSLAKAGSVDRPAMVRMLVSEAIKNRNLKAVGKDEAMDEVVLAQKKAMADVLAPFMEKLNEVSTDLRRIEGRIVDEFSRAEKRQNFLVLCARFLVSELLICRLLLRDYVHTAYMKLVEGVGKPLKEVEANFNARVLKYKGEAEATLNDLTANTVNDLHSLADSTEGFRNR